MAQGLDSRVWSGLWNNNLYSKFLLILDASAQNTLFYLNSSYGQCRDSNIAPLMLKIGQFLCLELFITVIFKCKL